MRRNAALLLTLLTLLAFVPHYRASTSVTGYRANVVTAQGRVGIGRFLSPGRGNAHQAFIPFMIRWELDNPAEVKSQDLILSTDGGATFDLKVAAYLPPEQRQLVWSAPPVNITGRAKLEVVLRLKSGEIAEVIGDEFSILPAPPNAAQAAKVAAAGLGINTDSSGGIKPAFAGTGARTSTTLLTLNYNMTHPTPCSTGYSGEPALAQNPANPSRFHTVTGFSTQIRSKNVDWAYSGTSTTGFLNAGVTVRGDLTVEIGIDGTVYAVGLGQSFSSSFPDAVLIFRSTDGGVTFASGVPIPKPPSITLVDKPVIAVHPTNAQVLAITFQQVFGGGLFHTWLAICKAAPAGNLSSASNWIFTQPVDSGGTVLKPWITHHPLIDPVSVGSPYYWLFIVFTNDDLAGGLFGPPSGFSVFKYQINSTTHAIENGGLPVQTQFQTIGTYPLWDRNPSCRKVELALRMIDSSCARFLGNIPKAAIDYCDPNAHRMYIPTLLNTSGSLPDGLTSDLYLTVWTYTGTNQGIVTKRILPAEKEKYVACAVTDGHGRVWVNALMTAQHPNNYNNSDNHRAQMGAIAIDRVTGDPGSIAYMSLRVPQNLTYTSDTQFFLGDYIYTQGAFYPDPNNPGNVNGLGSRIAMPTYTDFLNYGCSPVSRNFSISISGWN